MVTEFKPHRTATKCHIARPIAVAYDFHLFNPNGVTYETIYIFIPRRAIRTHFIYRNFDGHPRLMWRFGMPHSIFIAIEYGRKMGHRNGLHLH